MTRIMQRQIDDAGNLDGYLIRCPGCRDFHEHKVGFHMMRIQSGHGHDTWTFSGTEECPTFRPSLKSHGPFWLDGAWIDYVCHFHVTYGRIEYCEDSTHQLAGQTVPIPPWES